MGADMISVDIGVSTIKIVEGLYEKQKIKVKNYSIVQTPLDSFQNGIPSHIDEISSQILNEIKTKKIKTTDAVLTLSSDTIINREIILPKMSEKELGNNVQFEAPQYFPVNLENYKLDYRIIEEISTDEGPKLRLFVVAVPNDMIENYLSIAQKAGLNLKIIDVAGNTLSKIVNLENKGGEGSSLAIVEIGYTASRVVILESGKLRFERMIKTGLYDMEAIIKDCLSYNTNQAEKYLVDNFGSIINDRQNALGQQEEAKVIGNDIRKIINDFCSQINKLFEFYYARNSGKVIDKVYLTGGGAKLEDLTGNMSRLLNISAEVFIPRSCIDDKTTQKLAGNEPVLANALGAFVRL